MKKITETFVGLTIWIMLGAICIATMLGLIYVLGEFMKWAYSICA